MRYTHPELKLPREMIQRRMPDDILEAFFGSDWETRVKELILRSGGYPREIIKTIQNTIALKNHPVGDDDFNHILTEFANQYLRIVQGRRFPVAGQSRQKPDADHTKR